MAEFSVMPANARKQEDDFIKHVNMLVSYADQVTGIKNSLGRMGSSTDRIKSRLQGTADQMADQQKKMEILRTGLIEIMTAYETTERNICGQTNVQPQGSENNGGGRTEETAKDSSEDSKPPSEDLGIAEATGTQEDSEDALSYILDALEQALLGDFSDESNLLGTVLSVAIGFIPIVGQIADVRDLVADIWNLIDDGPTTEEWVALGFTAIGFLPGLGDFLKHGDEVGDVVKGVLRNADCADEVADLVKAFMRKGDEVFSAVASKLDNFQNMVKNGATGKLDDLLSGNRIAEQIKEGVRSLDDFLDNTLKIDFGDAGVSMKDFLGEMFDGYKGDMEEGAVTDFLNWITGGGEPVPEPAT